MICSSDDEANEEKQNAPPPTDLDATQVQAQLDELKKVFPNTSELDLQDALKDADWNVELAVKDLKSRSQNGHSEPKSLKVRPKKKKLTRVKKPVDSDSSDDDGAPRRSRDLQMEDDDDGYEFEGGKVYDRYCYRFGQFREFRSSERGVMCLFYP